MKKLSITAYLILLSIIIFGQSPNPRLDNLQVSIEWGSGKPTGSIEILNGEISEIKITKGRGKVRGRGFEFKSSGNNRIIISFKSAQNSPGPGATLVTSNTEEFPFSFFLRDVNKGFPIYIPEYKVVVLPGEDHRSYEDIETEIKSRKLLLNLQKIKNEPEESFESVEDKTRNQTVPTWLGISRDMRIFQISQALEDSPREVDIISPKNSANALKIPESDYRDIEYSFTTGRGQGVKSNIKRCLEDGVLPILHSNHMDGEISYHSITFTSLESLPLNKKTPIGTNFLVADNSSAGHMFTDKQQEIVNERLEDYKKEEAEQTVLYYRLEATNTGKVPRYAYYKNPKPGRGWFDSRTKYDFNDKTGFSYYSKDRVYCISTINGKPLPNEEMAVLLAPNETAIFEFYIPHSPVSKERAVSLSKQSFDARYIEAKKFWKAKLDDAAQIIVPEKRIQEMIQAGLLHLDLITYGKEPNGTLAPLIGVYSPIGTESAPIVQFYASMGLNDIARRSLMYFMDKQHTNGFIQNFGGYMVETGAALWSIGEYFRYTGDTTWIKQIESKLIKSCDYLLDWRERNKTENLRGKGYGMISGKVADPDDDFHQFMLNAYAYLGVSRVAESLQSINPEASTRLAKEAQNWKQDILTSFYNSMAHSPVVPLGNGSWCPTVAPWAEAIGPRALYVNKEKFFSHGTFTVADVLLGPLYLVFCEVLEPGNLTSRMMLNYHSELFYQNNSTLSQPYYSRHNWVQLKQGLVKPFLKTYYNTFSALADRETYTFWEHLYHASPHKTHEEAWFLMQTRWMMYLEDGQTLNLLSGVPRKWLENDKVIQLKNVASYFGSLSLQVNSQIEDGYIEATIQCNTDRKPGKVTIRLPHPNGIKASKVEGGVYNESMEMVTIPDFSGEATIRIEF